MGRIGEILDRKDKKAVADDIGKLLDDFDVEGLEGLIEEIYNVKELGVFDRLLGAFKDRDKIVDSSVELDDNDLQVLARRDLNHHKILPLFDSVDYLRFALLYKFFEVLYYVNIGRMLSYDDLLNVYFSGLDKRVVFGLDEFEGLSEVPEIPDNFFTKLQEVKWSSKRVKNFFWKFTKVESEIVYGLLGSYQVLLFPGAEHNLMTYLAACSAVKEFRAEIAYHDVVVAYRTYLKLLKTDITNYKAINQY